MRRGNEDGWSNARWKAQMERSWCEMGRAGTQVGAGKDRARGSAAPQEIAGVLRGAHARLALWRVCRNKACRRGRRCGGDVDHCGARCFPQAWAWLAQVAQAVRAGGSPRAAARAADLALMPKPRPRIFWSWRGWHETYEMPVTDENVERVRAAQAAREAERQAARIPRLAAAHSPWLRAALRR
jgi:hypothetical protein